MKPPFLLEMYTLAGGMMPYWLLVQSVQSFEEAFRIAGREPLRQYRLFCGKDYGYLYPNWLEMKL